jgi:hypothetical protein
VEFDPEIGIGASTPWQSCEGQDIMLRALSQQLNGYYDPSIYGYHDSFDIEAESGIQGNGRKYGRGVGYVLRGHRYGFFSALKWIGRPVFGSMLFLNTSNIIATSPSADLKDGVAGSSEQGNFRGIGSAACY